MDERLEEKDVRIAELKDTIAAKRMKPIKVQRSRIADLERQLAAVRMSDMDNYPLNIGAAES